MKITICAQTDIKKRCGLALTLCAYKDYRLKKIVIFGNSGSGKSTLARELKEKENLPHLDLDSIAWKDSIPPARKPINESKRDIDAFIGANAQWIVEGCYSDLCKRLAPTSGK
jgi:adenylate kinase family enzyme